MTAKTTKRSNRGLFLAGFLFVLLFSGPPRFRERDAAASLRGDIDAVVMLHVLVWALAGVWVLYQMRFYFYANNRPLRWGLPQRLGLGLVAALGLSTFVSPAPLLTGFKVYQVLVCMTFTMVFVERYGAEACLRKLFQASAVMCVALAVAAVARPDLVFLPMEEGIARLRGDYIAGAGDTSLVCFVLLLAGVQRVSKISYGLLLFLSSTLVVVSLTRSAYVALFGVFLLVLLKRPNSKALRRFAYVFGVGILLAAPLGLFSLLNEYRDPETVWTLSDRVGLWTYLSHVTIQKSPWVGLGYYAASRVYGPEYNPGLGTAHSIFLETFAGGGLLAATILAILIVVLLGYVIRLSGEKARVPFVVTALFLVTMLFAFVGGSLDSGAEAVVLWCVAAILPRIPLRRQMSSFRRVPALPHLAKDFEPRTS